MGDSGNFTPRKGGGSAGESEPRRPSTTRIESRAHHHERAKMSDLTENQLGYLKELAEHGQAGVPIVPGKVLLENNLAVKVDGVSAGRGYMMLAITPKGRSRLT